MLCPRRCADSRAGEGAEGEVFSPIEHYVQSIVTPAAMREDCRVGRDPQTLLTLETL
jgi:hypothetical protein